MPLNRDTNGNPVYRNIMQDADGTWSTNVWSGSGVVTDVRRYHGYPTKAAARAADISEAPPVAVPAPPTRKWSMGRRDALMGRRPVWTQSGEYQAGYDSVPPEQRG